jgi:hypothetical protein
MSSVQENVSPPVPAAAVVVINAADTNPQDTLEVSSTTSSTPIVHQERKRLYCEDSSYVTPTMQGIAPPRPQGASWLHKKSKVEGASDHRPSPNEGSSPTFRPTVKVITSGAAGVTSDSGTPLVSYRGKYASREERLQARPDYPPKATLEMFHFTVLFYTPPDGSGSFFELLNPARAETPLRLYRNSMVVLCEKLPKAMQEAKRLENCDYADETQFEIANIHQYQNTRVILYVSIFGSAPSIWVKLFAKSDEGEVINTTYGVKFSLADNLEKFYQFVISHK